MVVHRGKKKITKLVFLDPTLCSPFNARNVMSNESSHINVVVFLIIWNWLFILGVIGPHNVRNMIKVNQDAKSVKKGFIYSQTSQIHGQQLQ